MFGDVAVEHDVAHEQYRGVPLDSFRYGRLYKCERRERGP